MKASIYTQYGSPSGITIKEVDKPVPKDDEVLINVYATTVNRTDCAILRAKPLFMRLLTGIFRPRKQIMGTDLAGVVEAVGKNVTSFKVGDKVVGFNDMGMKSHAEFTTIREKSALTVMPSSIDFTEAVACIEGAHYAYNFINKVDIRSGGKVLVNGATGAIGSAAVQMLKYYDAEITAVCNAKDSELVQILGASSIIDYTSKDFTKTKEKYDHIFDTVGKSTFGKCKPILVPGGTYISSELGPNIQNPILALTTRIIGSKKVMFPFPSNPLRSLEFVKKLIEEGKFKAVIDRIYSLDRTAEAFHYVEQGQKIGNVVIMVNETYKP